MRLCVGIHLPGWDVGGKYSVVVAGGARVMLLGLANVEGIGAGRDRPRRVGGCAL